MTTIDNNNNNKIPDADITRTDPPTDDKTNATDPPTEEQSVEAMRAYFQKMMDEQEARHKQELEQVQRTTKTVRKARDPKPIIYWEGQVEVDKSSDSDSDEDDAGKWEWKDEASADKYADATFKTKLEYYKFMLDWQTPFENRYEKTAGKRGLVMKPLKEGLTDENRCETRKWNYADKHSQRCNNKAFELRGTHNICKRCKSAADNHLFMYLGWKVEYGTILGWATDDKSVIDELMRTHKKNPNYKGKPRGGKKD